jgi:uncharacterized membrane protein YagU involved in acid resistance
MGINSDEDDDKKLRYPSLYFYVLLYVIYSVVVGTWMAFDQKAYDFMQGNSLTGLYIWITIFILIIPAYNMTYPVIQRLWSKIKDKFKKT